MFRSLSVTILLLLFISSAYAQFDSAEVKAIRLIIEQNEYRGIMIDSLNKKINMQMRKTDFYKSLYEFTDSISGLKDEQIQLLEKQPVITEKTPFLTFVAIITSSIAAGLITGVLIAK